MKKLKELNDVNIVQSLFDHTLSNFKKNTKLTPVMATELEFFFVPKNNNTVISEEILSEITDSINTIAHNHGIKTGNISKETGDLQYEVNVTHSDNINQVINDTIQIKNIIANIANNYKFIASFDAKPYGDSDVGSGLHIHLSLQDDKGHNCFIKNGEQESKILLNSIGGLLAFLPCSIPLFITCPEDFSRYKAKFNIPAEQIRYKCNATNAPVNISWGSNNRTTAIRIPDDHHDPSARRIEHRVPACNANPYLAIIAILFAVEHGIIHNTLPQDKTWGNAFDEQYHLTTLPLNLTEAIKYYQESELHNYINSFSQERRQG